MRPVVEEAGVDVQYPLGPIRYPPVCAEREFVINTFTVLHRYLEVFRSRDIVSTHSWENLKMK